MTTTLSERHLKGLDGANVAKPVAFSRAQMVLANAVKLANGVAVFGPAGTGKTFAVANFVGRLNDLNPHVRTPWVEIPHRPRGKTLPVRILEALNGTANDRLTEDQLLTSAAEELAGQRTLLVIDEAHHLRIDGLFQVKYLYDAANFRLAGGNPQLAIALIGGFDLPTTLANDEQLHSRMAHKVEFDHLHDQELLDCLREYHDVFANTDDALLEEIDQRACRGSFRRWAFALQTALNPIDGSRPPAHIDRRTAERIIDTVGHR